MNPSTLSLWWLAMGLGLAASALYSGLETGIYRINRVRLQILNHRQHRPARILHRLVHQPTTLLSTLLIGNNIANYVGTASLAVILQSKGLADWQVIAVNILVITPALLIFGEVLPKDLFAAYSDKLTYPFARFLEVSRWLFGVTGLVPLVSGFNRLAVRWMGLAEGGEAAFHPRRQMELLVKEGVGRGLISDEQSAIVQRVLELSTLRVDQEMVAWSEVITLAVDDAPQAVWRLADQTSHSRFPVVDASGAAVGVISAYDVLTHAPEDCPALDKLMTPPVVLAADTPLRQALAQLQKQHAALAVVAQQGQPVGIVTIKDLVEPITGKLASW